MDSIIRDGEYVYNENFISDKDEDLQEGDDYIVPEFLVYYIATEDVGYYRSDGTIANYESKGLG